MTVRAEYFDSPIKALREHLVDFRRAGADAFGRGEDFYEDVDDHFMGSDWGQLIADGDDVVGFSLYSNLPRNGVHLEGVAIKEAYQGRKIGQHVLEIAMREKYVQYVTATTRNPATVRMIGNVAQIASPDIRLDNPLAHQDNFFITQASQEARHHLGIIEAPQFPYLIDRYPEGLYGNDPGATMPIEVIRDYPRNAVVVSAIL